MIEYTNSKCKHRRVKGSLQTNNRNRKYGIVYYLIYTNIDQINKKKFNLFFRVIDILYLLQ